MAVYEKTITSGRVKEIYRYETIRIPNEDRRGRVPRLPNTGGSPDTIQKANLVRAKQNLWRLMNCNFTEEDWFLTFTYKKSEDAENAEKEIKNFLRRLDRYRERNGLSKMKYIGVTESGTDEDKKRAHHHLLLPGDMDLKTITKIWGKGKVIGSPLDPTENYKGLAEYIAKEFQESSGHKKRWFQSRNLVRPTVTRKRLTGKRPAPIGAVRGHKVIVHEWAGNEYGFQEYVVAVKDLPASRKKKRKREDMRGRRKKE